MLAPIRRFTYGTVGGNKYQFYARDVRKQAGDDCRDLTCLTENNASKTAVGGRFWGDLFAVPYSVAPWGWPPYSVPPWIPKSEASCAPK